MKIFISFFFALFLYGIAAAHIPVETKDTVIAIGADQSFSLARGGKAHFADVIFPDAPLAQAWFASYLLQQELTYSIEGTDRYGCLTVHAADEEAMLRDGIALIFAQGEVPPAWNAAEQQARQKKIGFWANPNFILTPENAAQHFLEFHLIEGVVTHLYRGPKATYLNFGENWHNDFSVTITGRERRSFADRLAQVKDGSRVRVRGAIYQENGPMIRLTRPEQLEIISTP